MHKIDYKKILGYNLDFCPVCKSKTFDYKSYSEFGYGIVEQHGYCKRCGYSIEQTYSKPVEGFWDNKRGFANKNGEYFPKNVKKHKRIRRKLGIKNYNINPRWIYYI